MRIVVTALIVLVLGAYAPGRAATSADGDAVKRIENYLNGITTLRARFLQVAYDGTKSEGIIYIARPGRLRVEYDPPIDTLLVSDGDWLTFVDGTLGQRSQMPVDDTPAGFLVRADIRFGDDIIVTRVEQDEAVLRATLVRADSPGEGELTLVFTNEPFELRQWVVVDPQGLSTRITLLESQRGLALDPALFVQPPPFPEEGDSN